MSYYPRGLTRSELFFYILKKEHASFDDIDYFMKRKLKVGRGKGLDTVKDSLWPLIESQVIIANHKIIGRSDRTIEKSTFSLRPIYGLVDLAIVYLNVYVWGREKARAFQKSPIYKEKMKFNLEDLQKIITGNSESGILPTDYSFSNVLFQLPVVDPKAEKIYFYCESTNIDKYKKIKNVLLNNLRIVGDDIKKQQPLYLRLIAKRIPLDYKISEWNFPIFRYLEEKLLNSPEFAMSFFRVIAELLEETLYKNLTTIQMLQRAPQGLQQLWATELRALDSRTLYYQKDSGLWPKEISEGEIETACRIRYNLSDDSPIASSKIYVVSLFVLFLILHGAIGDHDRASIFSDLGISNEDFHSLIDNSISFQQLASYEEVRGLKEAEWIREVLPKKRLEVENLLRQRMERIEKDPKKVWWTKDEAFALCMQRADLKIEYCYSLIAGLTESGYAIIKE